MTPWRYASFVVIAASLVGGGVWVSSSANRDTKAYPPAVSRTRHRQDSGGPMPAVVFPRERTPLLAAPAATDSGILVTTRPRQRIAISGGRLLRLMGSDALVHHALSGRAIASFSADDLQAAVAVLDGSFIVLARDHSYRLSAGSDAPEKYPPVALLGASSVFSDPQDTNRFYLLHARGTELFHYSLEGDGRFLVPLARFELGARPLAFAALSDGSFLGSGATGYFRLFPGGKRTAWPNPEWGWAERLLTAHGLGRAWALGANRLYDLRFGDELKSIRSIALPEAILDLAVHRELIGALSRGRAEHQLELRYLRNGTERWVVKWDARFEDDGGLADVRGAELELRVSFRDQIVALRRGRALRSWVLGSGVALPGRH